MRHLNPVWLIVAVVDVVLLALSAHVLFFAVSLSGMMFDSPGSTESTLTWVIFWCIAGLCLGIGLFSAYRTYNNWSRRHYFASMLYSCLPIMVFFCFVVSLQALGTLLP